ncbi:WD domain repeat-containing protein 55 [Coemansia interrupta]|uniref:WD repeat-containing protein JIP5 n=1 Tax=Coemansia interrupta TaxID=1126814 RepID=A0A9W8LLM9_9FUNG|nr:WD domain repeat-containing protein 55 [Coemansia interrupta]
MDDAAVRPKSLKFKEPVIDVALCPTNNIVASSLITGHVFVHKYSVDGNERLFRQKIHKKSCRSVCFSDDGALLYTASKDRSWQAIDVETGVQKMCVDGAHDKSVNLIRYVNEQIVATGDDTGAVKLWDTRKNKPAFAYNEHVDYISDMVFNADKRHLLASSGDGCLSVYDVRKAKPYQVSANQDDELLSIALMRGGKKVVVGETDGVLGIFSYDQFADVSDRFPGHPQSIDTICKLTEDMCVTGSSDGLLRIVQLFPHKLVGVAGDHDSLPVEKVVLSHDKQWLASCSHDHTVHFWDIGYIFDDSGDGDDGGSNGSDDDDDEDEDVGEDVQATAIRISKEVGAESSVESDVEVDIDGCSDAGELRDRGADGTDEDTGDEAEADVSVDVDGADSDGWGDSDDSEEDKPAKKKRKMTKAEKRKARRLAAAELSNPAAAAKKSKQEKAKSATPFFADL